MHFASTSTRQEDFITLEQLLQVVSLQQPVIVRNYEDKEEQKKLLGEFYKEGVILPISQKGGTNKIEKTIDMKLYGLLDNCLDNTCINKWKESDLISHVVYVGVTGAGKTFQIQKHSLRGFVLYTTAADKHLEMDKYMDALQNAVCISDGERAAEIVLF
jgi:hypothetical protein